MTATDAGPPTSARPGKRAGEPGRVDPPIRGLTLGGVGGELALDGAQETDLGRDLRSEISERDRRVAAVELERRVGRGDPLGGPLGALMVVRRLHDHRGDPLRRRP